MTEQAWIVLIIAGALALTIIGAQIRDTLIAKYNAQRPECDCEDEDESTEEVKSE